MRFNNVRKIERVKGSKYVTVLAARREQMSPKNIPITGTCCISLLYLNVMLWVECRQLAAYLKGNKVGCKTSGLEINVIR